MRETDQSFRFLVRFLLVTSYLLGESLFAMLVMSSPAAILRLGVGGRPGEVGALIGRSARRIRGAFGRPTFGIWPLRTRSHHGRLTTARHRCFRRCPAGAEPSPGKPTVDGLGQADVTQHIAKVHFR